MFAAPINSIAMHHTTSTRASLPFTGGEAFMTISTMEPTRRSSARSTKERLRDTVILAGAVFSLLASVSCFCIAYDVVV